MGIRISSEEAPKENGVPFPLIEVTELTGKGQERTNAFQPNYYDVLIKFGFYRVTQDGLKIYQKTPNTQVQTVNLPDFYSLAAQEIAKGNTVFLELKIALEKAVAEGIKLTKNQYSSVEYFEELP